MNALLVELAASIRGEVAELTRGEVAAPGEVAGDDELIDGDGEWPPVIAMMRR